MITIVFLAAASFLLYRLLGGAPRLRRSRLQPAETTQAKIEELTKFARRLRANNKYTGAEKVYLQILKIDHRHAATYQQLGTLYMAMKNYADAIECFQLATQLSPSGMTFYNLGLALYENRNPVKAVAAFEKAVMFEPSAQRCIGLAKAYNRLGRDDQMVAALEQAAELEPNPKVLQLLVDSYEATGRTEELESARQRLKAATAPRQRLQSAAKRATSAARAVSRSASGRLEKT